MITFIDHVGSNPSKQHLLFPQLCSLPLFHPPGFLLLLVSQKTSVAVWTLHMPLNTRGRGMCVWPSGIWTGIPQIFDGINVGKKTFLSHHVWRKVKFEGQSGTERLWTQAKFGIGMRLHGTVYQSYCRWASLIQKAAERAINAKNMF